MESTTGPMRPIQQLGAAPGSNTLPGLEGNEPEANDSIDGAEFASSGEADMAPRAVTDDFDNELTEDMINYVNMADATAREQSMNYGYGYVANSTEREGSMNYVGNGSMNYGYGYVANSTERVSGEDDYPAAVATVSCRPGTPRGTQGGDAIYAQARMEEAKDGSNQQSHLGSNPGLPASSPAVSAQTPSHFGSIPAERANWDARLTRDVGISRQPSGHISQEPAERVPTSWDEEEARLQRDIRALKQQRAEEQFWAERRAQQRVAALRREFETLQRSPPQTTPAAKVPAGTAPGALGFTPRMEGGITTQPSRDLGPGWAWVNSRSVPVRETVDQQVPTPPGLGFLGRVPPSAARALEPPKRELLSAKGVSSEEKSSYFAEYRQGRVPGSPGLDQLRENAGLNNAPSRFSAGSTRRNLFSSDASWIRDPRASDRSGPDYAEEEPWQCSSCQVWNYAWRHSCYGCHTSRLGAAGGRASSAEGPDRCGKCRSFRRGAGLVPSTQVYPERDPAGSRVPTVDDSMFQASSSSSAGNRVEPEVRKLFIHPILDVKGESPSNFSPQRGGGLCR